MKRFVATALALVALAVACSSGETLACATAASTGACPSLDGVTSFCAWAEWGCARVKPCGGYYVLADEGTDARFTYYYAASSGAFVATVQESPGGSDARCIAGPAQFSVPQACREDTLAECGPPPRDGGAAIMSDAGGDGSFAPPVPSGSPSAQPLAAPAHPPR